MLEEVTSLQELEIYTQHGAFVGRVRDIVIDLVKKNIDGLYVEETNDALVENSHSINIPYRWVQSIGDIIILKHFPDRVQLTPEERKRLEAIRQFQEFSYE
ncbi:MAG: PRC-barrel domain-containing protein [Thermoplasmata archaeon]|nr:MAG: PRC-barrel domain-containing protein [Thermoplasmata archaeon]